MAKILLVDDSKFQRKCVSRMLIGLGHEVLQADNGETGLRMVQSVKPDMIITDLLMPVMDGLGLLRGLKENDYNIPTVVLTADIQESTRDECLQLGAAAFLNKPHNSEDLKLVIDKNLKADSEEKS